MSSLIQRWLRMSWSFILFPAPMRPGIQNLVYQIDYEQRLEFLVPPGEDQNYNRPFARAEFQEVVKLCTYYAPGPEDISFHMIRHDPSTDSAFFFSLYNKIWAESVFLPVWLTSYIIPILKPEKNLPSTQQYTHLVNPQHMQADGENINLHHVPTLKQVHTFSDLQFDFCYHRSTQDFHHQLYHDLCEVPASHKMNLTVFFDLEKA